MKKLITLSILLLMGLNLAIAQIYKVSPRATHKDLLNGHTNTSKPKSSNKQNENFNCIVDEKMKAFAYIVSCWQLQ